MMKRKFVKDDKKRPGKTFTLKNDEEISSDDDGSVEHNENELDDTELNEESVENKRLRLAKQYMKSIEVSDDSDNNSDEDEKDELGDRMKRDRLEAHGKYFKNFASKIQVTNNTQDQIMSGHKSTVTCLALSADEKSVYSGSKDNSVIHWDIVANKKRIIKPSWKRSNDDDSQSHDCEVLSVAISTDGGVLVSGGKDNVIRVFDPRLQNCEVNTLKGHRGAINCLAFQRDSFALFSGSSDRCIKHWDLRQMGYIETLFGHQVFYSF
jgi:ribosomal RNA-processing protein 9